MPQQSSLAPHPQRHNDATFEHFASSDFCLKVDFFIRLPCKNIRGSADASCSQIVAPQTKSSFSLPGDAEVTLGLVTD